MTRPPLIPVATASRTMSMARWMVSWSMGLDETSLPSFMTIAPFSAMTVIPGRPGNMSSNVHTWRPDDGANTIPRSSMVSRSSESLSGKFLSSSSRVPSMSTATRRRSQSVARDDRSVGSSSVMLQLSPIVGDVSDAKAVPSLISRVRLSTFMRLCSNSCALTVRETTSC